MLLPSAMTHATIFIIIQLINKFTKSFVDQTSVTYLCVLMSILCLNSVDALLHPILCLIFSPTPVKKLFLSSHPFFGMVFKLKCRQSSVEPAPRNLTSQNRMNNMVVQFKTTPEANAKILNDIWQRKS